MNTLPQAINQDLIDYVSSIYSNDSSPPPHFGRIDDETPVRDSGHRPKRQRREVDDDSHYDHSGNNMKPKRERCANACNRCKAKKLKCLRPDGDGTSCFACGKAEAECIFDDVGLKQARLCNYIAALETRVATLEHALATIDPFHPEVVDTFGTQDSEAKNTAADVSPVATPQSGFRDPKEGDARMRQLVVGSIHRERSQLGATNLDSILQPLSPPTELGLNGNPDLPPADVADKVLSTAYRHVQSRYPFMDWDRLHAWHRRRHEVCFAPADATPRSHLDDQVGAFFLWTTYAVGADLAPHPSLESTKTYLNQAMRYLDSVLLGNDLTTIRGLLLLLFVSFRSPNGPPLWSLCGFAMRLCLELYLHREDPAQGPDESEQRKRVFWSAYAFDRLIALASGRPFSIADSDIQLTLPVDVDVEDTDSSLIALLHSPEGNTPFPYAVTGELTTMSSAIHTIRHYRIRSRISGLYAVHPVQQPTPTLIREILSDLQEWRSGIPRPAGLDIPAQAEDKFEMMYFQAVLFTLRRSVLQADATDLLLVLCAMSAAESCERGRKVHQKPGPKHTICSLCHIFVSGMTLLHCLAVNPAVIPARTTSRALRSCSATLAIYAQQFPDAVPFRELFEYFTDEVMGSRGAESPGGIGAILHLPVSELIKQVIMGEFSQLSPVYEVISASQQDTPRKTTAAFAPPSTSTAPPFDLLGPNPPGSQTAIAAVPVPPVPAVFPLLNHDLANLNKYGGDLASLLEIPLDAPLDLWNGGWEQSGGGSWDQRGEFWG